MMDMPSRSIRNIVIAAAAVLMLAGCEEEYASSEARQYSILCEENTPQVGVARDLLAAALRYQIDYFAEKNKPKLKVCFLSILDSDPADELLARLEGTRLEVHKFSEWSTYYKNEQGLPYVPSNYIIISVRDIRILDSDHVEVDTAWNVSGLAVPGNTYTVERFVDNWRVTGTRATASRK